MMNLLDAIRKNQQQAQSPLGQPGQQLQQGGFTQAAQNLLATKATGKAVEPGAGQPATMNLGEQVAQQQAQTAQVEQAREAQLPNLIQEAEAQQTEFEGAQSNLELDEKYNQAQTNLLNQANRLLTSYETGQRQLDMTRKRADAEQLGFTLRLSNSKYLDNLNREARKNRLDNELKFKEALQRSIFDEELGMFQDNLDFRRMMNADERQFNDLLSQINIDFAMDMAKQDSAQANQEMMWRGISGVVGAGAEAYGKGLFSSSGNTTVPENLTTEAANTMTTRTGVDTRGYYDT